MDKAIVIDDDTAYLVDRAGAKRVSTSVFRTRQTVKSIASGMGASSIAVYGKPALQWFRSLNSRSMEDSSGLISWLSKSVNMTPQNPEIVLATIKRGDVEIPVQYDPATKVCHPIPVSA